MPRIIAPFAYGAILVFLPGCMTLFHKTEVVRGQESRRPVQFENVQAADAFQTALKQHPNHVIGGSRLGVPCVTLFSKSVELSESAAWNDAVMRCDTNQDGMITYDEAAIFAKSFDP